MCDFLLWNIKADVLQNVQAALFLNESGDLSLQSQKTLKSITTALHSESCALTSS